MARLNNLVTAGVAAYAIGSAFNLFGSNSKKNATVVSWAGTTVEDTRARLWVPPRLRGASTLAQGPKEEISTNEGIIFPYTPTITFERTASWTPQSVIHSNYNFYSYKNSTVSAIKLSAKFSVQNDIDAGVWLSSHLLLNALTKMPFGNDINAGSPPPVCRLSAYGGFMLDNVPVVVSSFSVELPDSIDYYVTSQQLNGEAGTWNFFNAGSNRVPTLSTFSLTLIPVYSRYEQMSFSVDDLLAGNLANQGRTPGKGYL